MDLSRLGNGNLMRNRNKGWLLSDGWGDGVIDWWIWRSRWRWRLLLSGIHEQRLILSSHKDLVGSGVGFRRWMRFTSNPKFNSIPSSDSNKERNEEGQAEEQPNGVKEEELSGLSSVVDSLLCLGFPEIRSEELANFDVSLKPNWNIHDNYCHGSTSQSGSCIINHIISSQNCHIATSGCFWFTTQSNAEAHKKFSDNSNCRNHIGEEQRSTRKLVPLVGDEMVGARDQSSKKQNGRVRDPRITRVEILSFSCDNNESSQENHRSDASTNNCSGVEPVEEHQECHVPPSVSSLESTVNCESNFENGRKSEWQVDNCQECFADIMLHFKAEQDENSNDGHLDGTYSCTNWASVERFFGIKFIGK